MAENQTVNNVTAADNTNAAGTANGGSNAGAGKTQYSLNDDRRVRVLSPGALVARRFFRNRVAVVGMAILIFMFLFSFLGGVISPYKQDQLFYRTESRTKNFASVKENEELRFVAADPAFDSVVQAQMTLAITQNKPKFKWKKAIYSVREEGEGLYVCLMGKNVIGLASADILTASDGQAKFPFEMTLAALTAYANGESSFEADGTSYEIDETGSISAGGSEVAYIGRFVVQAASSDIILTKEWKDELLDTIAAGGTVFTTKDKEGNDVEYDITYEPSKNLYHVKEETETYVFDTYAAPSREHWLGTDKNGMDMLTRLMYGGRVSLIIGFLVEIIATGIGVILGGISGYFGGWVDNLIMRIVDVFYCIPSMPLIIIIGAVMDKLRVDPWQRMIYLMLILGFLSWPGIARLVRGQILSLREQEFMMAAEATGLSTHRRIFRHLIPNVIPQLVVSMTMGLGGTIITEATLSFLGLGVKFPFASWGNIINDVNNTFVLTNYWFIWIPAGVLLLLTVLAFNLVGDGLRDAFDPRMNR